ncbi:DUF2653 family protein [Brevibacillus ginsengisoli]|uniref:DUF2653 family protein n=1 Tax=Brevibacillus ginsengisoli TaxID=363854 RepID=UPI003CF6D27B
MNIHFCEQDVVDSVCVYFAHENRCAPEDVDVDLQFNPSFGFAAEVKRGFHQSRISEQQIIDSIAFYLADYHSFIPDRLKIDLQFHEHAGIEADIIVE